MLACSANPSGNLTGRRLRLSHSRDKSESYWPVPLHRVWPFAGHIGGSVPAEAKRLDRMKNVNPPPERRGAGEDIETMKSLFERLLRRRLASTFVLLATLSAAIVGGSFLAHGVRGQEQQNASTDASPLKVVSSVVPANEFEKIAKIVGPAVVNINTQTLPKQSANHAPKRTPRGRHAAQRSAEPGRRWRRSAGAGPRPGWFSGLLQPLFRRTGS